MDTATIRTDTKYVATHVRTRLAETQALTTPVIKMTEAQYPPFCGFWKYEVFNGAECISGMHINGGSKTVRPVDAYSTTHLGNRREVTFTVEWEH